MNTYSCTYHNYHGGNSWIGARCNGLAAIRSSVSKTRHRRIVRVRSQPTPNSPHCLASTSCSVQRASSTRVRRSVMPPASATLWRASVLHPHRRL